MLFHSLIPADKFAKEKGIEKSSLIDTIEAAGCEIRDDDLVVGWRFLMLSGVMVRHHCQGWADNYINKAWSTVRHFRWVDALDG